MSTSVRPEPDYDAVYRGEEPVFHGIPWDIGRSQPAIVEAVNAGLFSGEVLDIGCGLGDNAIFLSGRGYRVTGLDSSPTAIDQARKRAAACGAAAEFAVADALALTGYENRFDTALDSALYHCFGTEERQRTYAAAVRRALKPGGTLHILCMSDRPGAAVGPQPVSEENLRHIFADGWQIQELEAVHYFTTMRPEDLPDLRQRLSEVPGLDLPPAGPAELDDRGNILMPAWHLAARRRD